MRNVRLDEIIRLRVSPAFKANVEAEADRRGATVSELVRQALNELFDTAKTTANSVQEHNQRHRTRGMSDG